MRRRFLLAYDIRDEHRLRLVHGVARAFGDPLQYSLFVCDLSRRERLEAEAALRDVMNLACDSVVFVDLGEASGRGAECFAFLGHRPYNPPSSGPLIV